MDVFCNYIACLPKMYVKAKYHANENPLKNSETIAYVDQRLMYPIIKKIIHYHISLKTK